MQATTRDPDRFDLAAAAVTAILFGLFPLTSSDLWWHLAAGREIWARDGIPLTDPFSFASDRGLWLDHGWLFQAIVYPLHAAGGPLLLQVVQLLIVFGIALAGFRQLARDGVPREVALLTMAIVMACAKPRLTLRPELLTLLLLAILLGWLRRSGGGERWPIAAVALTSLVWTNLHPGAILGGLVLLVWCLIGAVGAWIERRGPREIVGKPALMLLSFSLPLVITPYGVDSLLFPFRLRELVTGGGFINTEWQPATPARLPLLFVCLAAAAILFVLAALRAQPSADRISRVQRAAVAFVLGYLAIRYQRNVGVFAAALPFVVGPEIGALSRGWSMRALRVAMAAAGTVALLSLFAFQPPGFGINRAEIAADATEFVKRAGIRGRMFNQARFGGYLIWTLYPNQKVLIDGRNEVYTKLLPRMSEVVGDDRKWRRFLRDERIEWAIIGYNNPAQRVQQFGKDGAIRTEVRPFGYNHFPPGEWALVYWDDVAMVLVRRGGMNRHLEQDAPRYLWPESVAFAAEKIRGGEWPGPVVAAELEQAVRRRPGVRRAYALADLLRER